MKPRSQRDLRRFTRLACAAICLLAATGAAAAPRTDGLPNKAAEKSNPMDDKTPQTLVAPHAKPQPPRGQVTPKMLRYARRLVQKYDANADGRLSQDEYRRMRGDPRLADYDGDGFLTERELAQRVADYGWHRTIRLAPPGSEEVADATSPSQPSSAGAASTDQSQPGAATATIAADAKRQTPSDDRRRGLKFFVPAGKLPSGLPEWFAARDLDGDGQLTLAEFSPQSHKGELDQFALMDQDGDGVLIASEYLRAAKAQTASGGAASDRPSTAPSPAPPSGVDEGSP